MNALKGNVGNSVEAPKGSIDIENILLPTKRSISLCPLTKAPFMYNLKGFDKNFFYSFLDFLKILDYVSRSEKVPKEISDELSNGLNEFKLNGKELPANTSNWEQIILALDAQFDDNGYRLEELLKTGNKELIYKNSNVDERVRDLYVNMLKALRYFYIMKKGGKKIDLTKFKDFTKRTITALMTKPPKPNAIQTSTLQQVGQALTTK